MNSTQTFTIIDIIMAVFKSPIKFTLWFLVFFSLVVLAYLVVPREYGSDGKLFVQVGRSSVGAGPTTSAATVSLQDSRETEVKTVVDLMASRELAAKVVDIVGVERILKPNSAIGRFLDDLPSIELGGAAAEEGETDLTEEEIEALNRRNKAVKALMETVDLQHEKNTTIVSIGITAQTPFLAQEIVESYLDEYKKMHVKVNTPQASGFFDQQLKTHKSDLLAAEKGVQEFRSKLNVLDVNSARLLLQKEIDQLKLDALATAVKLSEAQEKSFKITNSYAKVPEFIVGADTVTSSLARNKARESLYNLEIQESELASKYNPGNPKLVAIRETIKKAKKQLSRIPQTFKQAERNMNPAHKELMVMMTKASADADGFQKRLQATEALIQLKIAEVDRLNKLVVQENALMREVDIQRKTMLSMADKTAESATIDALDSERISNVTIAQEACLVPKKTFPSGMMFAVLGGALSALLATMMTFMKDFKVGYEMDRRDRQRHLQQPPARSTRRPRRQQRRPVREPALARSGAVREDFHPADSLPADSPRGYEPEGDRFYDDQDYDPNAERALHQELQDEEHFGAGYSPRYSEADPEQISELEARRLRREQQVNVLGLVGGFSVLIVAYLFIFVFTA